MSYPLPPLPKEEEPTKAPQLSPVALPNALQALSGLFLLSQAMPQMVPQATAQLQERQQSATETQMAQYQLQVQAQQAQAERQQREFDRQMQLLRESDRREQDKLDQDFRTREEQRQNELLNLQKQQVTAAAGAAKLNATEFKVKAASLLGSMFNDALDRVEATQLDPATREKLLMDAQTNIQFQALRAKDPKGAEAWLAGIGGGQLTTTEKLRRATEMVLSNPGATEMMRSAGLTPEEVFRPEFLPQAVPESPELSALSEIVVKRAVGGNITIEEERNFATALQGLGGTAALNKMSDDLSRLAEVKYGVDREQFEQNLAELIDTAAGPEQVALSVPSEPPKPGLFDRFKKAKSPEDEIKSIREELRKPLLSPKKRAKLRARLQELGVKSSGSTEGY